MFPRTTHFSATMLLFALSLTLVAGLTVAARLVEPACPACSAKSWTDHPPRLECTRCGWSNVATVTVSAEPRPAQYEITL